MPALNSGRWVFCDFQIGWAAAGAGVCMIEMAVGCISYGRLSAFFTGHVHPFHMPQTRITLLASDNEEKKRQRCPDTCLLPNWTPNRLFGMSTCQ